MSDKVTEIASQKIARKITKEYDIWNTRIHQSPEQNSLAEFMADAIADAVFNSGNEDLMNYFEANASR